MYYNNTVKILHTNLKHTPIHLPIRNSNHLFLLTKVTPQNTLNTTISLPIPISPITTLRHPTPPLMKRFRPPCASTTLALNKVFFIPVFIFNTR